MRRLPRLALLLFCLAYVIPGFLGRSPWKTADLTSMGYMRAIAEGRSDWMSPTMFGVVPDIDALLPYWIGAWALRLAPDWINPDLAARIPFVFLLISTLAACWYGTYYLARDPQAQPVAFAFGGEARPTDYARAIADGAVLALIACLGLAQLSHEVTPAQVQLACAALVFYGVAAIRFHGIYPALVAASGLLGLTLSGAPSMAMFFGAGASVVVWKACRGASAATHARQFALFFVLVTLGLAVLSSDLNLWRWRLEWPQGGLPKLQSLARLLLWFTWPAGALALWTLWRWRRQWWNRSPSVHLAWPLWLMGVSIVTTLTTGSSDRSLLLALPALAALAAFALPTLGRSLAALVDWFTLLFFSGSALIIWVVWVAMQTGVPRQPAANVVRLAPGFEPTFSAVSFVLALIATVAWAWLVAWRVGRHRWAIWKSLVLPAGGAALCWLLLMTLWLPLLDYARSNRTLVSQVSERIHTRECVEFGSIRAEQLSALQLHSQITLRPAQGQPACPWLMISAVPRQAAAPDVSEAWTLSARISHPMDRENALWLFTRKPQDPE
ncbi:MAG: hypothetical protein RJA34_231 [Pseudomonadota bacterium]